MGRALGCCPANDVYPFFPRGLSKDVVAVIRQRTEAQQLISILFGDFYDILAIRRDMGCGALHILVETDRLLPISMPHECEPCPICVDLPETIVRQFLGILISWTLCPVDDEQQGRRRNGID
jgi:hypothetical protein